MPSFWQPRSLSWSPSNVLFVAPSSIDPSSCDDFIAGSGAAGGGGGAASGAFGGGVPPQEASRIPTEKRSASRLIVTP